jgi:hypothetical protein
MSDFSDLRALFVNCTLKRTPETSNTQGLMDVSMEIIPAHGNQPEEWSAGCSLDFPNPEHRR